MMHETPEDVAAVLARHAPRRFCNVLDPAAGHGALIVPLLKRIKRQRAKVVCIDVNDKVFPRLREVLSEIDDQHLRVVNSSFVEWGATIAAGVFDMVVMNPPFAARKSKFIKVDLSNSFPKLNEGVRHLPVEAAFIVQAMRVLKNGGRLLAILPASLISAESTAWFRRVISKIGAFRVVHELPPRTFTNVETRVYLCVIDRGSVQQSILLQNHDLLKPQDLKITKAAFDVSLRLDFGYFSSSANYRAHLEAASQRWPRLGDMAEVIRGGARSPAGPRTAVHTTDYVGGFWRRATRHRSSLKLSDERRIRSNDLLVKRVGRACTSTFGAQANLIGARCSDCVLIVRSFNGIDHKKMLFAVRILLGFSWASALIAKGTGASYITHAALEELRIPYPFADGHEDLFNKYLIAIKKRSISAMNSIEAEARSLLIMESGFKK